MSLPAEERAAAAAAAAGRTGASGTALAAGQRHGTETDATLFARALMAAGEFARAADVVADATDEPLAAFLHFYASYLASEKRKEDGRGDFTGACAGAWPIPAGRALTAPSPCVGRTGIADRGPRPDLDRTPANPDLLPLRDQVAPHCAGADADAFLLYLCVFQGPRRAAAHPPDPVTHTHPPMTAWRRRRTATASSCASWARRPRRPPSSSGPSARTRATGRPGSS